MNGQQEYSDARNVRGFEYTVWPGNKDVRNSRSNATRLTFVRDKAAPFDDQIHSHRIMRINKRKLEIIQRKVLGDLDLNLEKDIDWFVGTRYFWAEHEKHE